MAEAIFLAGAVRTPIGRFGGTLAALSAPDLGVHAARAALERAGLTPDAVDYAIFGHGRQAGQGPSTGRQVAVRAGVPVERPAFTVNMACGSGLKSVLLAADAIRLGHGAGGAGGRHREHEQHALLPAQGRAGATGSATTRSWTACTTTASTAASPTS